MEQLKWYLKQLKWYVKQLFPLLYVTTFTEEASGKRRLCIWRMWLGCVFNAQYFELAA